MKLGQIPVWTSIAVLTLVSYYKYSYFPESKKVLFSLFPMIFYYHIVNSNIRIPLKFIILFSIFVVEVAEMISFYTTKKTFSLEFFNSLNVEMAYKEMRGPFLLVCFLLVSAILLVSSNIAFWGTYRPFVSVTIANLLIALMIYLKFRYIYHEIFSLFENNSFQSTGKLYRLMKYMIQKHKIVSNNPRKNLLVIVMESTELQNLGPFNHDYKHLMPFLSNLALNTTVFTNVVPQPLIGYSISSFFCSVCGFPVIFTPNVKRVGYHQGDIQLSPMFKCIPDILKALNYSNYFVMTGNSNWGNLQDFAKLHNYSVFTSTHHKGNRDIDAFRWINRELIPKLKTQQPFYLTFENMDTHTGTLPNSCLKTRSRSIRKRFFQEFDCLDGYIKELFQTLKDNDLYDNTEIVIYGDHFYMGQNYNFVPPRSLVIILPKHNYGNISKPTSLYDLTHIMLHLVGIKVTPKFPFGNDPLSPNYLYNPPSSDDIKILPKLYFQYIQPNKTLTERKKQ